MPMNVTLYKNCKVDNKSKMGYWRDNYSQRAYFNSLDKYTEDVKTVKLGDPLTVKLSVNQLLNYNYGHIDYGDGFRYYFSIDDIRMLTETMSDIYYSIDCYETLVTQKPFRFGRANITRQPTKPGKIIHNIDSSFIKHKNYLYRRNSDWATMVCVRWDSVDNIIEYIIIVANANKFRFFDGSWFKFFHVPGAESEIIQCVVTKGRYANAQAETTYVYRGWSDTVQDFLQFPVNYLFGNNNITIESDINNLTGSIQGIQDNRGNIIFQAEKGESYTIDKCYICANFDTIHLEITFVDSNKVAVLPLEPVPFIIDNWSEYSYRQRAIDKETRNLQMNKQLISDIGQSIGNAGNTSAFGKMGGGGGSAGMGLTALAGGLASAGINYATNAYFSPKEQELIDKTYQYANDDLTNYGEFTYWELMLSKLGIVSLVMDSDDANRKDIATNGYLTISSYDNFVLTKGKWKGDVEILNIDTSWGRQIQERFLNGVDVV